MGLFSVHMYHRTYKVTVLIDHYFSNKNLAIELFDPDNGPFARLTVNLRDGLPENQAYVDTNNCPWAEEFIAENGIGKPLGVYERSGWCEYPLYEFDLDAIRVH